MGVGATPLRAVRAWMAGARGWTRGCGGTQGRAEVSVRRAGSSRLRASSVPPRLAAPRLPFILLYKAISSWSSGLGVGGGGPRRHRLPPPDVRQPRAAWVRRAPGSFAVPLSVFPAQYPPPFLVSLPEALGKAVGFISPPLPPLPPWRCFPSRPDSRLLSAVYCSRQSSPAPSRGGGVRGERNRLLW